MAEKKLQRYQLTLTDTTAKLVYALQKYGHNIRDILNAGIVLYDQSDNPTRAMAEMRANCNLEEEIDALERRLATAKREQVELSVGAGRLEKIKKGFGLTDDAAAAKEVIAGAEAYEAAHLKKRRGNTSKSA